jgi:hypothetical protein
MKHLTNGRTWIIASFAVFWILLMAGWTWWDRQTPQAQYHMLGTLAYKTVSYDLANEYFDKSLADYQSRTRETNQGSKAYYFEAPGSLEMAQLSLHLKALSLLKMKDGKTAVLTFKEALKLTTDQALSKVNLDTATLKKLREDRRAIQINLEILFQQQPQMAKQEGKGKGGQQGEGKQSEDPSKSGPNAGKMDRNAL